MSLSKRIMDIVIALVLGVLLAPFLLLLMVVLLIREGHPIFYISERMKTPEQGFGLIKLRTMHVAAGDGGVTGGNKQATMSGLHRALRRSRADELPQLWNVLRGDISLVGPRPPLRRYVDAFPALYAQVLQNRPGITGLASLVFHAHEERLLAACTSADDTDEVYRRRCIPRKAQLDLIYQRKRGFCYDLVLIGRTAAKPFRRG
jgi:lipopolysaccharide/colanic/teichoic acid biosynthesis glycosyltransferase